MFGARSMDYGTNRQHSGCKQSLNCTAHKKSGIGNRCKKKYALLSIFLDWCHNTSYGTNKKDFTRFARENPLVPEAGLEPAQDCSRGILSPLRLPIPPFGQIGGTSRIRTGDKGFADLCLTTWLRCHNISKISN